MLKLLTLLLLAAAQLKIRYTLNNIYDTKIVDLSHNGNHAVKDAPGGASMINTPSGLYLSQKELELPPNIYSGSFSDAEAYTASVFVRFFGSNLNQPRVFFSLKSLKLSEVYESTTQRDPRMYLATVALDPQQLVMWTQIRTTQRYGPS
jgi:hypothetical protein